MLQDLDVGVISPSSVFTVLPLFIVLFFLFVYVASCCAD